MGSASSMREGIILLEVLNYENRLIGDTVIIDERFIRV